ncbi:hypothetical protein D3C73_720930 [compost metagenome]
MYKIAYYVKVQMRFISIVITIPVATQKNITLAAAEIVPRLFGFNTCVVFKNKDESAPQV